MKHHCGFTFIEMLVAMAIAVGMMLFVNSIVGHSVDAVRLGEATSQIIEASRMISDQVTRDIEQMVPPSKGGVLMILNKSYTVRVLSTDAPGNPTPNIRSDQLIFVRFKGRLEPLCPQGDNSFTYDANAAASSSYVRMWYGHCVVTEPDGTTLPPTAPILGAVGERNEFAANWVFGRQALFLVDNGLYPAWATHHAENARTATATVGATLDGQPAPNQLFHGTTDVAAETLRSLSAGINPTGLLDKASALSYAYNEERLRVNLQAPANNNTALYAQGHSSFVQNCSSFTIQFAGDYDGDGQIDKDGPTVAGIDTGNIIWYGVQDDGTVFNPPQPQLQPVAATLVDSGYIFGSGMPSLWPRLIRMRFRLHADRSLIAGSDGKPGRNYEIILPIKN
jgi:prepilin-type N-terminal cleavage/methylation domain-containing protein